MDLHLTGKRVLVTGACKGIGRAAALLLAEEGCDLVLVSRNQTTLAESAAAVRDRGQVAVQIIPADLSQQAEIERVAGEAGDLDILVKQCRRHSTRRPAHRRRPHRARRLGPQGLRKQARGFTPWTPSKAKPLKSFYINRSGFGAAGPNGSRAKPLPCFFSSLLEEIASAVAFLASSRSGYTTGTILTIDGAPG